jgi:hypothetical protein
MRETRTSGSGRCRAEAPRQGAPRRAAYSTPTLLHRPRTLPWAEVPVWSRSGTAPATEATAAGRPAPHQRRDQWKENAIALPY